MTLRKILLAAAIIFQTTALTHAFAYEGNDPRPFRPGRAQIFAQRQFCYTDLCTYQIYWNARFGTSTVLTVQIPGETPEKLMSCGGPNGRATANWVAPGKTYIFRLYESTACTVDVNRFLRPSAVANVRGGF